MKALSVRQPWAWLIVAGIKWVENRTWATDYRGPLVIHAARTSTLTQDVSDFLVRIGVGVATKPADPVDPVDEELLRLWASWFPDWNARMYGTLLGQVELVDVVHIDDAEHDQRLNGEPFAEGPWCWILRQPRVMTNPIRWRGQLRLFDVPDGVLSDAEFLATDRHVYEPDIVMTKNGPVEYTIWPADKPIE